MNDFFIQKELNEHIKTTLVHSSFYSNPDLSLIFSMVFLQSYGFLEQKMACITWEMAHRQYYDRYDFVQKRFEEMSWKNFIKIIKKLGSATDVKNLGLDIDIPLINKFQNNIPLVFDDELAYPFYILKNKIEELRKNESFEGGQIKNFFENMSQARNYLAHFKSFYALENTFSLVSENGWNSNEGDVDCFSRILLYIVLLIQLDQALTNAYKRWNLRNY